MGQNARSIALLVVLVLELAVGAAVAYRPPTPVSIARSSAAAPGVSIQSTQTTAIARENALAGGSAWMIASANSATTEIQAYTSSASVAPGGRMTFYVTTQAAGASYRVDIYRIGWYSGAGGRLLTSLNETGQAQGYYDPVKKQLVNCGTCHVDPATHLVEAGWKPSFDLTVPTTWVSGVYMAQFTTDQGKQTYLTFDVRGDVHSTYVVVTPDTTVAAYNQWGGYSLYQGPDGSLSTRAVKVSLDRPVDVSEAEQLPLWVDSIRWIERQGYDVSYISDIDLHEHPGQVLTHRAYISLGHDEYWSLEMRNGVEQARDHGVGLLFLGANTAYWQVRMEPDSQGTPDRTVVCYKDASQDPLDGIDNARVTTNWRDAPVNRPENGLIGVMFSNYTNGGIGFPWRLVAGGSQSLPLLDGTGLKAGTSYGCAVVGYEWDRVFDNAASPPGLHILGTSNAMPGPSGDEGATNGGGTDVSNTTYYVARSGALVFASGTIYWSFALDSLRMLQPQSCSPGDDHAVPQLQRMMVNVMDAVVVKHTSR